MSRVQHQKTVSIGAGASAAIVAVMFLASASSATSHTLTVTANHGSVAVTPDKATYDEGEAVELIPRPDTGYCFTDWAGDAQGRRLVLRLTMDGDKAITANFGMWHPPIGIPAPVFGIFETHRMYEGQTYDFGSGPEPYRDAGNGPYTHYVDNTNPDATDDGNPCGTADKPRATMPGELGAGSVVEVHGGPYRFSWRWFAGLGEADRPIFIRGANPRSRVRIEDSSVRVGGRYLIIENLELMNTGISFHQDYVPQVYEHIAIRNMEMYGRTRDRGSAIGIGRGNDVVLYGNHIHHNGNVPVGGGTDMHGIGVFGGTERIWVLDNHTHHNDGDSLQVNACGGSCCENNEWAKYVYIGRNVMHGDRENAIDLKDSEHVIISQNEMYGYTTGNRVFGVDPRPRPVHGSDGTPLLPGNEGGRLTWVLFNDIHDSMNGIRIDDECVVANSYIIGNTIYNIERYGLITWRTMNINLFNNTVYNVGIGFYSDDRESTRGSSYVFVNNIFSQMNGFETPSRGSIDDYIRIGIKDDADRIISNNNLFYQGGGFEWGRRIHYANLREFAAHEPGKCQGYIEADPLLVRDAGGDFRLQTGSPAIDAGMEPQVYQDFYDLYGIEIRRDINGRIRPAGSAWDIGAYEYVFRAVDDLSVSDTSQNSVTLVWTVPSVDGPAGEPARYDIRYAEVPLTEGNWDAAAQAKGEPVPGEAGGRQSFTLADLNPGTSYHIALKMPEETGHSSALSNRVVGNTLTTGNHASTLQPIGDRVVVGDQELTLIVSAEDVDPGDTSTYSITGLPTGAVFDPVAHTFTWTPAGDQSGVFYITFHVSDGHVTVSETVAITAGNRPPVLTTIGDKGVVEEALLSFSISAADPDGNPLTYSATGMPDGASFLDQVFAWTPANGQAGTYQITFQVSDGLETDSETVKIKATEVLNRAPKLVPFDRQSASERVRTENTQAGITGDVGNSRLRLR